MKLHYLQNLQPAPRQQFTISNLLQSIGKGRERYTKANQSVTIITIYDTRNQIQISLLDIIIYILIYLTFRKLLEIIKVFIGFVYDMKHLSSHTPVNQLSGSKLMHMQIVSFLYHLCSSGKLGWGFLRHLDAIFQPVIILLIERHGFHVVLIIRIIIIDIHGRFMMESLDEQSFTVHICKAKRSYALSHSLCASPSLNSI